MSELKGQSSFFKKIEAQVEQMGVRGDDWVLANVTGAANTQAALSHYTGMLSHTIHNCCD